MKALYVVNKFPKLSESFVLNEIHELDNRGHDISVFSLNQPDERITHDEIREMDLTVHYAEQPSFRSLPDLFSSRILSPAVLRQAAFIDDPLYHAYCLHLGKQLIEAVESEGDIDLVHAHFAAPNRLAITYAAAYHDIPCTVTAHAYEIFKDPDVRRLQRVGTRFNHVVVPSEYNRRYLREEIGIKTDMTVVPATTSVDKFDASDSYVPGRLLTVARLVEKKGHEFAIDAVAQLVNSGYDIEYHLVGLGEREEFLRERVREHGIEENIDFLGHVSDERLETELQEAEQFVMPCVIASDGDRDAAPVALKEAMASETACISTSISAIPELITNGKDGLLVDPRNSEALANAIATLFDNPEQCRELAEKGRETVETKFDISRSIDKLEEVFEAVK